MQEGTEGFQRAIGKPFGRLRRGEIPAKHAEKSMKMRATQSRERVKGQCPLERRNDDGTVRKTA